MIAGPLETGTLQKQAPVEPQDALLGLDPAASAFLRQLLTRSGWSRQVLAAAASELGLPLDAVLEQLNETAYERLALPLFEPRDDPVVVLNAEAIAGIGGGGPKSA